MKYFKSVLLVFLIITIPDVIFPGIFGEIKKAAGTVMSTTGSFFGGNVVGGALGPATKDLGVTLSQVTNDFNGHMQSRLLQFDSIAAKNLETVDASIENRLNQFDEIVKENTKEANILIGENINLVDKVLQNNLKEADTRVRNIIKQFQQGNLRTVKAANEGVAQNIVLLDKSIESNLNTFEKITTNSLVSTNKMIEDRLNQFDEIIYKNVGAINSSSVRFSHLFSASLINFTLISIILGALAILFLRATRKENYYPKFISLYKDSGYRDKFLSFFAKRILNPLLFISALLILVKVVAVDLFGPKKQIRNLVSQNIEAFESSLKMLNSKDMYYYGVQLEFLNPKHRKYKLKAEAFRAAFSTLAVLEKEEDFYQKMEKVKLAESVNKNDPDLKALQSYLIWRYKKNKYDEYKSACYAAKAVNLIRKNRTFALSSIAKNYLRNYLERPMPDSLVITILDDPELRAEKDRKIFLSNKELRKALNDIRWIEEDIPSMFDGIMLYDSLATVFNQKVQKDYVKLLDQNFIFKNNTGNNKQNALIKRKSLADSIIQHFDSFESQILVNPLLKGTLIPLTALKINDAIYCRAKMFKHSNEIKIGTFGDYNSKIKSASEKNLPLRARLAPKYLSSFNKPTQAIQEYYETQRFIEFDKLLNEFEIEYLDMKERNHAINEFKDQESYAQLLKTVELAYKLDLYKEKNTDSSPSGVQFEPLFYQIYYNHKGVETKNWIKNDPKNHEVFKRLLIRFAWDRILNIYV